MPTVLRPDLPPAIDEVFARVLAKRPDERYGNCREFIHAARCQSASSAGQNRNPQAHAATRQPGRAVTPGSRPGPAGPLSRSGRISRRPPARCLRTLAAPGSGPPASPAARRRPAGLTSADGPTRRRRSRAARQFASHRRYSPPGPGGPGEPAGSARPSAGPRPARGSALVPRRAGRRPGRDRRGRRAGRGPTAAGPGPTPRATHGHARFRPKLAEAYAERADGSALLADKSADAAGAPPSTCKKAADRRDLLRPAAGIDRVVFQTFPATTLYTAYMAKVDP